MECVREPWFCRTHSNPPSLQSDGLCCTPKAVGTTTPSIPTRVGTTGLLTRTAMTSTETSPTITTRRIRSPGCHLAVFGDVGAGLCTLLPRRLDPCPYWNFENPWLVVVSTLLFPQPRLVRSGGFVGAPFARNPNLFRIRVEYATSHRRLTVELRCPNRVKWQVPSEYYEQPTLTCHKCR